MATSLSLIMPDKETARRKVGRDRSDRCPKNKKPCNEERYVKGLRNLPKDPHGYDSCGNVLDPDSHSSFRRA
jgi:hypothetical protein